MTRSSEEESLEDRELLHHAIVRLRSRVMAVTGAMTGGFGLGLVTAWHVLRAGRHEAPNLGLLANYFPGYSVTWSGVVLGILYGAATGGVVGWALAGVYNRVSLWRNKP